LGLTVTVLLLPLRLAITELRLLLSLRLAVAGLKCLSPLRCLGIARLIVLWLIRRPLLH